MHANEFHTLLKDAQYADALAKVSDLDWTNGSQVDTLFNDPILLKKAFAAEPKLAEAIDAKLMEHSLEKHKIDYYRLNHDAEGALAFIENNEWSRQSLRRIGPTNASRAFLIGENSALKNVFLGACAVQGLFFDNVKGLLELKRFADIGEFVSRDASWSRDEVHKLALDDKASQIYYGLGDSPRTALFKLFDNHMAWQTLAANDTFIGKALEEHDDKVLDRLAQHGLFENEELDSEASCELVIRRELGGNADEFNAKGDMPLAIALLLLHPDFLKRNLDSVIEEGMTLRTMCHMYFNTALVHILFFLTEHACPDEAKARASLDLLCELAKCDLNSDFKMKEDDDDDEALPLPIFAVMLRSVRLLKFMHEYEKGVKDFEIYMRDSKEPMSLLTMAVGIIDNVELVRFMLEHGAACEFHPENPMRQFEDYHDPLGIADDEECEVKHIRGESFRLMREARDQVMAEYHAKRGEPAQQVDAFSEKLSSFNEGFAKMLGMIESIAENQNTSSAAVASLTDAVSVQTRSLEGLVEKVGKLEDRVATEASATEVASLRRKLEALDVENRATQKAILERTADPEVAKLRAEVAGLKASLAAAKEPKQNAPAPGWGMGMFGQS